MHNILLTATTTTTTTTADNPFGGFFEPIGKIVNDLIPFLPIVVTALIVIVGAMLLSGKKGREHVKDNIVWYLLGISCILGASVYASYFVGKFTF